jgi:hypothetical protein
MAFTQCYRAASPPAFDTTNCFFFGGPYVPPGESDPACRACPGWIYLRQAYADHVAAGGERMDIRSFRQRIGCGLRVSSTSRIPNYTADLCDFTNEIGPESHVRCLAVTDLHIPILPARLLHTAGKVVVAALNRQQL